MDPTMFDFRQYFRFLSLSFLRAPDTRYRSHKVHTFWAFTVLFIYPIFACVVWLFFFIDDVFRPSVKKQKIEKPVFIVGNFRCGSTFLQRLLNSDGDTFSSANGWEIMFAPSFSARQLCRGIYIVDKWFGSPLRRLITWMEKKLITGESIHEMGLTKPEEDEGIFIHCFASAFMIFASPDFGLFTHYYKFDELVAPRKKMKSMAYLEGYIKRHMRFHRRSRYYLSKSPTFSARCLSLKQQFPDARFIYLLRNPMNVLPSLVTWFSQVWSTLQKTDTRFPYQDFLVEFVRHWYVDTLRALESLPQEQVKVVMYDDLASAPLDTVKSIYSWLEIPMTAEFHHQLYNAQHLVKKRKEGQYRTDDINFDHIKRVLAPVIKRFSVTSASIN